MAETTVSMPKKQLTDLLLNKARNPLGLVNAACAFNQIDAVDDLFEGNQSTGADPSGRFGHIVGSVS